jgi:hypothetical protein
MVIMGEERKSHRRLQSQRVTKVMRPTVRMASNQGIWNVLEED